MCGICGVWGSGDNREAVGAMVSAMRHRGPDDRGVSTEPNATLGMTRLAIIDTSAGGHQPMQSSDGQLSIVYNGELYNFRDERRQLEAKGHKFNSTSDTEVVLRMYEHYGDDFVLRMRGMFSLAIYDKRQGPGRERLLLARDHLGIKPLLFAWVGQRLIFASEIKALLASGLIKPEVDPVALRLLLTYGSVTQPRTILRGVNMLLPAHRMIVEGDAARIERYWSLGLDRRRDLRGGTYEEMISEMASVLEESVRLQLVSDVPLGAFLSGGIDSSLMVAWMARLVSDHRVKTFSVGFENEGDEMDETDIAEHTARFIGTDHTRVVVRGEDVRDRLNHIAYGLDQPSVDGVNSYFISLAARQAVTVAISGTGGDELFAGYPWFGQMALEEAGAHAAPWKAMARSLLASLARRPTFDPLLQKRGGWRLEQLRNQAGFRTRYALAYQIFGATGAGELLDVDLRHEAQTGRSPHYDLGVTDELPQGSALDRVSGLCLRGYTNNQLLRDIDAVSMAHSLEIRVPYLDPVVADTALSLPASAKLGSLPDPARPSQTYREAGTKRILLDIGKNLLPEGFDTQPKRGFAMPFAAWLRGPLREALLDTLSAGQTKQRGLLRPEAVERVRDKFLAGSLDWPYPWLLMMIELWMREVLTRAPEEFARSEQQCNPARIAVPA